MKKFLKLSGLKKIPSGLRNLIRVRTLLQAHEKAGSNYLKEGIKTLELCQRAYSLYSNESAEEKANVKSQLS